MAEKINIITSASREDQYLNLIPQMSSLLAGESDPIANMANISSAIKETFGFLWVGFYRVVQDELVLSPFQGKIACTRIKYGKGVCGTAWKEAQTQIVADVNLFEGHITCDAESVSEIVVPIIRDNKVVAVLDIDSEYADHFSEIDSKYLNQITDMLRF
ncbi:MAG: GAF domain-containing protein [Dysgonomonas sp.]